MGLPLLPNTEDLHAEKDAEDGVTRSEAQAPT